MLSAALVLLAVLFRSLCAANAASSPAEKYGIMMDAGSSGTRIKVYKYFIGRHSPLAPSDIEQVDVPKPDKIEPGISTFGENVGSLQAYLKQLIDDAQKSVPVNVQPDTPIKLYATAGMRLLPSNQKKAILNEVDRLFLDKKFCPFSYRKGDARIITGEEEGIYAWITVNFLEGRFSPSVNTAMLGAVDLGGASTQNSYRVSHVGKGFPTLTVHLAGEDYPLYVHSYLGYGVNEAIASYLKYLASNSTGFYVASPCHNKYYLKKLEKTTNRQIVVIGNYNRKKCRNLLQTLFFCKGDAKQCPFVSQPDLEGAFVGMSNYYEVMKDIGAIVENQEQPVSFRKFTKVSNRLCKKSAMSLDTTLNKVENLCFEANYIYELLKDGYHINFNTFNLRVKLQINGFDLSWALGAFLYKSNIL